MKISWFLVNVKDSGGVPIIMDFAGGLCLNGIPFFRRFTNAAVRIFHAVYYRKGQIKYNFGLENGLSKYLMQKVTFSVTKGVETINYRGPPCQKALLNAPALAPHSPRRKGK